MIEPLDLLIWNVAINKPLCLFACPKMQLLAEGVNVFPVLWTTRE